ncbi:hypothetical protein MAPG_11475 [Magnaporthiopsis poae ATCC 64411]|uniref:Uncharacterized protein n=1 Tax=Magnaporthiopsis poae (strain ATCC 64411 / 73-15) TaxID=644358 RepID=A0A0C4EFD2_MAGP6|nr:hypothetical protein MAPG_11475 [Magnaporthiopsis poae ATCC 64411]
MVAARQRRRQSIMPTAASRSDTAVGKKRKEKEQKKKKKVLDEAMSRRLARRQTSFLLKIHQQVGQDKPPWFRQTEALVAELLFLLACVRQGARQGSGRKCATGFVVSVLVALQNPRLCTVPC